MQKSADVVCSSHSLFSWLRKTKLLSHVGKTHGSISDFTNLSLSSLLQLAPSATLSLLLDLHKRSNVNTLADGKCSSRLSPVQSEQNLRFLPRIPSVSNRHVSTKTSRSDTAKLTKPWRPYSILIPSCPTCLFNTRCFPFQYLSIWRDCRVLTISTGFTAVSWLISVNTRMGRAQVRVMGSGLSG